MKKQISRFNNNTGTKKSALNFTCYEATLADFEPLNPNPGLHNFPLA